jgi:hypothetical protein
MNSNLVKYVIFTTASSAITGIVGMFGAIIIFEIFFKTLTSDWYWLLFFGIGSVISAPLCIAMAAISLEEKILIISKNIYKYYLILFAIVSIIAASQGILGGYKHSITFSHGWLYLYMPAIIGSLGGGVAFVMVKIINRTSRGSGLKTGDS